MTDDRDRRRRPRCEDPGPLDEAPEQEAEFRRRINAELDARIARAVRKNSAAAQPSAGPQNAADEDAL